MSSSDALSVPATEQQHRNRERSLNAHHASCARHEADFVVPAESQIMAICDARFHVLGPHG